MEDKSLALHFLSSGTEESLLAQKELVARYGHVAAEDADIIVALGGDGTMLQALRDFMNSGKPIYGMNRGSVGFLMNEFSVDDLPARILAAQMETIRPLVMVADTESGQSFEALAINEVSLFRQSYQAAKIRITIDGKVRLDELVCDGVTVRMDLLETEKRPVNAVADNNEVKSVRSVTVREAPNSQVAILFDRNHSWDERILTEQFRH